MRCGISASAVTQQRLAHTSYKVGAVAVGADDAGRAALLVYARCCYELHRRHIQRKSSPERVLWVGRGLSVGLRRELVR